jgi:hypothetical protein
MLVRVSTRKRGEHAIGGALRYFARLPVIGEFLALSSGGQLYQVEHLVHCPFPCGWSAEIFAVEVDHNAIMAQVFADAKGSTNHIAEDDPDLLEVKPKLMDRLVFEPHNGQWLRETLDESGQIYDVIEIGARGASLWLDQTLDKGKRIFDLFDPAGVAPISKDELVAALREAADELEAA